MKEKIRETIPYIIIIIVVVLIRSYVVTPIRVNGSSMYDTLHDGDIMLLFKQTTLKRNSIVVVDKKFAGSNLIKRIIALPGENIMCEDGILYINGKKYNDKYSFGETDDFDLVTLKKDEYFVMGDNRVVSEDSRYLGPVKEKFISGTTSIVLFPFNRVGAVK